MDVTFSANGFRGIAIPIPFTAKATKGSADTEVAFMDVYFSWREIEGEVSAPKRAGARDFKYYCSHHVYGAHRYLIPVTKQKVPRHEVFRNVCFAYKQVGQDPTTATTDEVLQLLPCNDGNLELFLERLQSEPFYLELAAESLLLHAKDSRGRYVTLPARDYGSHCWRGYGHPVVSVDLECNLRPIHRYEGTDRFKEIPWTTIGDHVGGALQSAVSKEFVGSRQKARNSSGCLS